MGSLAALFHQELLPPRQTRRGHQIKCVSPCLRLDCPGERQCRGLSGVVGQLSDSIDS